MKTEFYRDTISNEILKKVIYYDNDEIKNERYYLNNKQHRVDGPAIIWYNNGKLSMECYYLNNECHRENGPAIIEYDNDGSIVRERYYLNHAEIINPLQIEKINNKSIQEEPMQEEFENINIKQNKKRKIFIIEDF